MAPNSDSAQWTLADEKALLSFLKEHIAEGGDSATFKKTTFHEASLEVDKIWTKGGKKVGPSCQNKWNAVRYFTILSNNTKLNYFQAAPNLPCHSGYQVHVGLGLERCTGC